MKRQKRSRTAVLVVALAIAAALSGRPAAAEQVPQLEGPLSQLEAPRHFRLPDGLQIELVAAEPDVVDPVAIRFDEDGRMWVVEMRDYPHGPAEGEAPKSRIRILEDTDGDGRYETARTFADELLFATGVQPWKGGAFVTLSGKLVYMKDTDGDGEADEQETWFTGFTEQNPQLRANHPRLGLDNRVYVANGLRGGSVLSAREEGAKAVSLRGRDFRFDPQSGSYESVTGNGQFGVTFDDFGNRFYCSNRNPLVHVVLEDRYLKRNPLLAVTSAVHDVAASGAESRVYPLSPAWTTSNLHAGQFTAACGVLIYRGDALPEAFQGNAFTCEPTGNLVHREIMRPAGATFASEPAREEVEFLATPDPWFRAVNLRTGPDGALYVVDMYRAVIEHPQFMPDELKNRPDLRRGDNLGRIYRISRQGFLPQPAPRMSRLKTVDLLELLAHENSWQRETAARLIFERQDNSVHAPLQTMALGAQQPVTRVRALWALEGLGLLSDETLANALADSHPRVREQAVKLAEGRLDDSGTLAEAVLGLANARDARLRFQVALSLGEYGGEGRLDALLQIALAGSGDPWTRIAVETSVPDEPAKLLVPVVLAAGRGGAGRVELVRELSELVGAQREEESLNESLRMLTLATQQRQTVRVGIAGLVGVAQGLARRGDSLQKRLANLPDDSGTRKDFNLLVEDVAKYIAKDDANPTVRSEGIELLKYARTDTARAALLGVAQGAAPRDARLEALAALAANPGDENADDLLADYRSETPAVRRAILDVMLADRARTRRLLEEIEAGGIAATEIDPARANQLLKHRDAEIRGQAQEVLGSAVSEDREKVLQDYQVALALDGEPLRGKEVFKKNCATCHRIAGEGVDVAPDISDTRTKKPAQMLTDILQPNRAIDANYVAYSVVMLDGRVLTGIIVSETASSITLKQPEGKVVTLLRSDIDQLASSGKSLMPNGLEKNITPQQMADLISFLKNWRYLDGSAPDVLEGD